ncbi:MAG: helix-turn-helix transcriptional regulator [Ornithinimicrobium sp.]
MSTPFRNVDVDASLPLDQWPYEALMTLLERGSIGDWAQISAAIAADPWGEVARQVEDYLTYSRPYGVAGLLERAISRARSDREDIERAEVAGQVRELVRQSGLSTADFATRIGTSRSRLSTYRSGKVIPSATLMARMHWLVDRQTHGESRAHTAS